MHLETTVTTTTNFKTVSPIPSLPTNHRYHQINALGKNAIF